MQHCWYAEKKRMSVKRMWKKEGRVFLRRREGFDEIETASLGPKDCRNNSTWLDCVWPLKILVSRICWVRLSLVPATIKKNVALCANAQVVWWHQGVSSSGAAQSVQGWYRITCIYLCGLAEVNTLYATALYATSLTLCSSWRGISWACGIFWEST